MTAISITLPATLAIASQNAAKTLGVSRTQFIRQAILHELNNYQTQLELEGIIKSFAAMKDNKKYLIEAQEITEGLNATLPDDEIEWWKKK